MKLSVIMPLRNEFPNYVHTVYSIIHALEVEGFKDSDYEIILVDNGSDDVKPDKPGVVGTPTYLMPRGMYSNRTIRILHYPISGNHSARNKGAEIARGEYLFITDAHMAYRPGSFSRVIKTIDETDGIVHIPIGWMGAYPPFARSVGYQYTIKLGEEIKGTWANRCLKEDDWFYIPALGHCSLGVRRKQFLDFGGYPEPHRTYGGGEFYVNMKWWMFGKPSVCEPRAVGYHLASERGYSYNFEKEYIHNVFNIGHSLGMDDWTERAYLNWCRTRSVSTLTDVFEESKTETIKDRAFIEKRRKYTFNELLLDRPWDRLNMKKHGIKNGGLQIFHDTWLSLIKGTPIEKMYKESKHQAGLDKFINEQLGDFIYKRGYKKP